MGNDGETDVLVVGAGPAGLALALAAVDHGASVRVVERRAGPFGHSRALIVHPRTLEVLRPFGVTDELLARGDVAPSARLHLGGRELPVELGPFALEDTAFPHLLFLRQAVVEEVLTEALAARDVVVEHQAELVDSRRAGRGVEAVLERPGGGERISCRFLVGCDGASSTVRSLAGVAWRGRPYPQEVVLADLELAGELASGVAHVVPGRRGLLFLFALGEGATWRLLVTRPATGPPASPGEPQGSLAPTELQAILDDVDLPAEVGEVAWSATVRLQRRLAAAYRAGPVFLVGDAAHAHSPAGGQGMNTGIQDAANLAWKLAFTTARSAPTGEAWQGEEVLLGSYELERRPIEQWVLALTHALFWAEAGTGRLPSFLRHDLAPLLAPLVPSLLGRRRLVAEGVRVLSQLRYHYRRSPLSVDGFPPSRRRPRPGDRLPDARVRLEDGYRQLHELLASPGAHLLLGAEAPSPGGLAEGPSRGLLHLHRLLDRPGPEVLGVRPDGYLGLRSALGHPSEVLGWLELVGALGRELPEGR